MPVGPCSGTGSGLLCNLSCLHSLNVPYFLFPIIIIFLSNDITPSVEVCIMVLHSIAHAS